MKPWLSGESMSFEAWNISWLLFSFHCLEFLCSAVTPTWNRSHLHSGQLRLIYPTSVPFKHIPNHLLYNVDHIAEHTNPKPNPARSSSQKIHICTISHSLSRLLTQRRNTWSDHFSRTTSPKSHTQIIHIPMREAFLRTLFTPKFTQPETIVPPVKQGLPCQDHFASSLRWVRVQLSKTLIVQRL